MSVVSQEFIDSWEAQYDNEHKFWNEIYEKYDVSFSETERDAIREKAYSDEDWYFETYVDGVEAPQGRAPIYLATAGAPLSGKSTVLDNVLDSDDSQSFVRIDPDVWCGYEIPAMNAYFQSDEFIEKCGGDKDLAREVAYNVMRPATNFITLRAMQHAFEHGLDIAHGTTSTNPAVVELYKNIKAEGYTINMILVDAPEDLRLKSGEYRANEQKRFQVTADDIKDKAQAFFERMPVYFENADNLQLYWRDGDTPTAEAVLAADLVNGELVICDAPAFSSFVEQYEGKTNLLLIERVQSYLFKQNRDAQNPSGPSGVD